MLEFTRDLPFEVLKPPPNELSDLIAELKEIVENEIRPGGRG